MKPVIIILAAIVSSAASDTINIDKDQEYLLSRYLDDAQSSYSSGFSNGEHAGVERDLLRKRAEERTCAREGCDITFEGFGMKTYCSPECKKAVNTEYAKPGPNAVAKICRQCTRKFYTSETSKRIHCKNGCKSAAYRARNRKPHAKPGRPKKNLGQTQTGAAAELNQAPATGQQGSSNQSSASQGPSATGQQARNKKPSAKRGRPRGHPSQRAVDNLEHPQTGAAAEPNQVPATGQQGSSNQLSTTPGQSALGRNSELGSVPTTETAGDVGDYPDMTVAQFEGWLQEEHDWENMIIAPGSVDNKR